MVAHVNLVAALAAEQAGLLLHALVFGVDLAFADAQIGAGAAADDGETDASTDIRLLGLVVIGVLQALQREVATHGGGDFVCADLRAFEGSVSSADQADLFAGVQQNRGLSTILLQKINHIFKEQLCWTLKNATTWSDPYSFTTWSDPYSLSRTGIRCAGSVMSYTCCSQPAPTITNSTR